MLFFQHAAFLEGAKHIDLLAEVFHHPLEQCELIHVQLTLLDCFLLGRHATARTTYHSDCFFFLGFRV
jgi:hypothetical protein